MVFPALPRRPMSKANVRCIEDYKRTTSELQKQALLPGTAADELAPHQ